MVQTVMNFLYIGNFADVDTDETNWTAENASSFLGAHDPVANVPIAAKINSKPTDQAWTLV